ncbi:MAG: hypothetical protein K1X71_00730 [Pirellulales bacterium]|nr:hypothetical protein [Pirellulales bacterium]
MSNLRRYWSTTVFAAWAGLLSIALAVAGEPDRSPVDLAISADETLMVVANQTVGTLSLVDLEQGKVIDETPCGGHPAAVVMSPDEMLVLATAQYSGDLCFFELTGRRLRPAGQMHLGFAPVGIAISPDGSSAYVALSEGASVAVVDLANRRSVARIDVGHWPRYLALSPDGARLAVGASGAGGVTVIDTVTRMTIYQEKFAGLNLGQMQASADGTHVYVPWITYGGNPITAQNIRRGWVIASRLAKVRLDGPARREAIAIDVQGQATGDPHAVALSPDESWIAVSASGSHELLVFKNDGLPWMDYGGPGDTMDEALAKDDSRCFRIALGGRPLAARFSRDGERLFVANYLLNAVQVVSIAERCVTQTIALGGPDKPSLARRGEAIFYDARRSLDQWYSCHSCHYEGGVNAVKMDTRNDGGFGSFKTVIDLHHIDKTGPWTWHGWQQELGAALRKSLTETMLGPEPTDDDVAALAEYLSLREAPSNPYRAGDGALSAAAMRGKLIFESDNAGCLRCHHGAYFTDGKTHDVGLGSPADKFDGFNTPSLLGVHRRIRFLHDGRATSLEEVLQGPHHPSRVSGGTLSDSELADLVEYLKSL